MLFANLADHTYVVCGTGAKRWSFWGGKTGKRLHDGLKIPYESLLAEVR